jgi:hypothetical protein
MRLWSLHPKYLDARGLVALWREALLAQAVLKGETRGYVHHPQLLRFRDSPAPLGAIADYLREVHAEALRRGYNFDATKISTGHAADRIAVTRGQLDYEWAHLKAKLKVRDLVMYARAEQIVRPVPHPLFRLVPGPVAAWEKQ